MVEPCFMQSGSRGSRQTPYPFRLCPSGPRPFTASNRNRENLLFRMSIKIGIHGQSFSLSCIDAVLILIFSRPNFQDSKCFPGPGAFDLHLTGRCPQNPFIFDRFRSFCSKNIPDFEIFVHFKLFQSMVFQSLFLKMTDCLPQKQHFSNVLCLF